MKTPGPYSRAAEKLADKQVTIAHRGKPCIVCKSTNSTCAHHIIPRGHKLYRHDPRNLITLCPGHHKGFYRTSEPLRIAPHSADFRDVADFKLWFEVNHPERFEWCGDRRHDTGKSNHLEWYEFWKDVNDKDETYKWTCRQLGLKHPWKELEDGD